MFQLTLVEKNSLKILKKWKIKYSDYCDGVQCLVQGTTNIRGLTVFIAIFIL